MSEKEKWELYRQVKVFVFNLHYFEAPHEHDLLIQRIINALGI